MGAMRSSAAALSVLVLIHAAIAARASDGAAAAAHVTWSADACLKCHVRSETAELAARTAQPCRSLCVTCHELTGGHHPVGVPISRRPPAPLLLTRSGTNTCVTCHDVTRPRFESTPWISRSLLERVVHRTRKHRTFHLVLRNDRGQLCRNCH